MHLVMNGLLYMKHGKCGFNLRSSIIQYIVIVTEQHRNIDNRQVSIILCDLVGYNTCISGKVSHYLQHSGHVNSLGDHIVMRSS